MTVMRMICMFGKWSIGRSVGDQLLDYWWIIYETDTPQLAAGSPTIQLFTNLIHRWVTGVVDIVDALSTWIGKSWCHPLPPIYSYLATVQRMTSGILLALRVRLHGRRASQGMLGDGAACGATLSTPPTVPRTPNPVDHPDRPRRFISLPFYLASSFLFFFTLSRAFSFLFFLSFPRIPHHPTFWVLLFFTFQPHILSETSIPYTCTCPMYLARFSPFLYYKYRG